MSGGVQKALDRLESRAKTYYWYVSTTARYQELGKEAPPEIRELRFVDVAVTEAEVAVIDNLIKEYVENLTGKPPNANVWEPSQEYINTVVFKQMRESGGKQIGNEGYIKILLRWIEATKTYIEYLDGGANQSERTEGQKIHFTFFGDTFMGDKYGNITNSTVVVRSSVQDAFNKISKDIDQETGNAIVQAAEIVENSNNPAAGSLYTSFAEELKSEHRDTEKLKSYWDALVTILPDVASVGNSILKVFS
jgi:hypothetical protein